MKELYIHVPVVLIQSNIGYDDRAKNMGKQLKYGNFRISRLERAKLYIHH